MTQTQHRLKVWEACRVKHSAVRNYWCNTYHLRSICTGTMTVLLLAAGLKSICKDCFFPPQQLYIFWCSGKTVLRGIEVVWGRVLVLLKYSCAGWEDPCFTFKATADGIGDGRQHLCPWPAAGPKQMWSSDKLSTKLKQAPMRHMQSEALCNL